MNLPRLLDGWHWRYNAAGAPVACLWTLEYDVTVSFEGGSIHISSGVAPWEIVHAVLVANKLLIPGQEMLNVT